MDGYIPFVEAAAAQAAALEVALPVIRDQLLVHQRAHRLEGPGPILVGIGASHAAAAAPVWQLRSRGIHAWRLVAGDHPLPFPDSRHPVVGISQGGRSSETLAVLTSVDPGRRYAVTNVHPSPISDAASVRLWLGGIPDSYASTIGYTATIAGLGMLAEAWDGATPDPAWACLPDEVRATEAVVRPRAAELAATLAAAPNVDVVGAASSLGSAEAGALLLREVSRMPSAAMSTRQYLHGSMESAGAGVHLLLGEDRERELATMLATAGHRVILVTSAAVEERARLQVVRIPALAPSPRAILEAVVLQALAASVAELAGLDIQAFVFHSLDTKVDAATTPDAVR